MNRCPGGHKGRMLRSGERTASFLPVSPMLPAGGMAGGGATCPGPGGTGAGGITIGPGEGTIGPVPVPPEVPGGWAMGTGVGRSGIGRVGGSGGTIGPGQWTSITIPVPVKVTVCVLPVKPPLLSVKISEALKSPTADGVNVTPTVQVLPGETVAPEQVSEVLVKSPAFAPLNSALEMLRFAAPLLVKVTCWALDGKSTSTGPKFSLLSGRLTAGKPTNKPNGEKPGGLLTLPMIVPVGLVQLTEPATVTFCQPEPLASWKIIGPGGHGA